MKLTIENLSKTYDGRPVLEHVNLTLSGNSFYCLMGPSGSGKTTFLRILSGLEQADGGTVTGLKGRRLTMVFQEDRLCEEFTPLENVTMVLPGPGTAVREIAYQELTRLLPAESITRPVSTLSGGMKRRTAICRALLPQSDIVLMDEPFTGLDIETKKNVISYIKETAKNRLFLISTHQEEDASLLDASLIHLFS